MVKCLIGFVNMLVFNRKFLFTFLLVLFGVGSYTYSEISTSSFNPKRNANNGMVFLKSTNNGFFICRLSPASCLKRSPEKTVVLKFISESIMDTGKMKSSTLAGFLKNNNHNIDPTYAQTLAQLYVEEANSEGVNPDIAFAQMCLETGFLRFDGTVDKHQNNFCGLGVTGNGVKGQTFKDARQGIRAHIQHLKAYASIHDLNNELIDKRFYFVKRGSGTHLSDLTGKWATDINYDKKIRSLMNRLYRF